MGCYTQNERSRKVHHIDNTFLGRSRCFIRSHCRDDERHTTSTWHARLSQTANRSLGRFLSITCICDVSFILEFEYRLFIDKDEACNVQRVTELIQEYVPAALLDRQSAVELVFGIQRGASKEISRLITALDGSAGDIAIHGYGLSMTTVEEVFLK